jgi:uncharacterized protein
MRKLILAAAAFGISATFAIASPSFAQSADPTMHQIYEAAENGHLDQAQQMITQVLADHPNSAKAHYVQAELFAKQGKMSLARAELGSAERLNPGLTEFNARSVQELKAQLGQSDGARAMSPQRMSPQIVSVPRPAPHFPWGALLIGVVVVTVLMMLFRRRTPNTQYPAGPGPGGAPPGYGAGPGYGAPPMGGGGLGSGIAGGLASGLAVGAGVVAGEELAHHFLDGGHREGGVIPSANAAEPGNGDMGGNDFGANDSGSWDDGGGMGGGGGDDWS